MEASITLKRSEQKRLLVLNAVVAGQSMVAEAAASLGLSVRQVRRVLAAYQREGAATLAHGNRGSRPAPAASHRVIEQVLKKKSGRGAGPAGPRSGQRASGTCPASMFAAYPGGVCTHSLRLTRACSSNVIR